MSSKIDDLLGHYLYSRRRLACFLGFTGSVLIVVGLCASDQQKASPSALSDLFIALGVSAVSMTLYLWFESVYERIQRAELAIIQGLDFDDVLQRLGMCRKGMRVMTTWTPLLCSRSEHDDGMYERLREAVRSYTDANPGRRLSIEIVLIDPRAGSAEERARELGASDFYRMILANYNNALDLIEMTKKAAVAVRVLYYSGLPPFSYCQVDHYINIGFFVGKTDSSHAQRYEFSAQRGAGYHWRALFKELRQRDTTCKIDEPKLVAAMQELAQEQRRDGD